MGWTQPKAAIRRLFGRGREVVHNRTINSVAKFHCKVIPTSIVELPLMRRDDPVIESLNESGPACAWIREVAERWSLHHQPSRTWLLGDGNIVDHDRRPAQTLNALIAGIDSERPANRVRLQLERLRVQNAGASRKRRHRVRRFAFRSWPAVALFVTLAAIAAAVILPRLHNPDSGAIAGFAISPAESLALARRAIADTPWLGSGVGTYRLLVPTYQHFGSAPALEPPSTAISIAIEWGKPALFILVAFAVELFVFVFRCAVRRGRDAFFPSAAAGAVLVMLGEAFCDSSLLTTTVQIVVAMMVGLSLSQSVGRTSGLK